MIHLHSKPQTGFQENSENNAVSRNTNCCVLCDFSLHSQRAQLGTLHAGYTSGKFWKVPLQNNLRYVGIGFCNSWESLVSSESLVSAAFLKLSPSALLLTLRDGRECVNSTVTMKSLFRLLVWSLQHTWAEVKHLGCTLGKEFHCGRLMMVTWSTYSKHNI